LKRREARTSTERRLLNIFCRASFIILDRPASGTHKVMMMLAGNDELIISVAVLKIYAANN
jgi:hypothetical protein